MSLVSPPSSNGWTIPLIVNTQFLLSFSSLLSSDTVTRTIKSQELVVFCSGW